ncbi:uncharacterized protein LOC143031204 isoform X2 [Oratosquilla oratoria]|uniref:uncharacterized protein LOC143031204 isoform X2 n=1 Tax=Oratosquilla oratoria TaxID=337810 RepID=UPI003F768824
MDFSKDLYYSSFKSDPTEDHSSYVRIKEEPDVKVESPDERSELYSTSNDGDAEKAERVHCGTLELRSCIMWTPERTLSLIEMLNATPCLWDVTCQDYKNRGKKKDTLQKLANKFNVSSHEMEKKVHSLKTQFRREHKKLSGAQRSGCSVKSLWFGYEPLLFLLQGHESRGSRCTDDDVHEDIDDVTSFTGEEEHVEDLEPAVRNETSSLHTDKGVHRDDSKIVCSRAVKRRAVDDDDKKLDEAYSFLTNFSAQVAKRDEHSVFGEHVANKLRNCGRSRRDIAIAQHRIEGILFDLEMGIYEKHDY